jgi:ElaA protein
VTELRRSWAKDLDASTLYELLKVRAEVFVVEQACPYLDPDGADMLPGTRHFWLVGSEGAVLATLRLMEDEPSEEGGEPAFRIGRVCTAAAARGHGYATRLMEVALAEVGSNPCRIHAQTYLADMYGSLGFVQDGDEFVEDGIPHVPMLRPAGASNGCMEGVNS